MKLYLHEFRCGNCGHKFREFDVPEDSYGEFVLWDGLGNAYQLLSDRDPEFNRFSENLKEVVKVSDREFNRLFHNLFWVLACDQGQDGEALTIHPPCHSCRTRHIASWEVVFPPVVDELSFPDVTHSEWNSLQQEEKMYRIRAAVRDVS